MKSYAFAGIEFVPAVVTNIGDDYAEVTFLDKPAGKTSRVSHMGVWTSILNSSSSLGR